jgi:hypothetical protein
VRSDEDCRTISPDCFNDTQGPTRASKPPQSSPNPRDIVIDAAGSTHSVDYETLLHAALPGYIRGTPAERSVIVDEIMWRVAQSGGSFIEWSVNKRTWKELEYKSAFDYTANQMKMASGDVLEAIRKRLLCERKVREPQLNMQEKNTHKVSSELHDNIVRKRALQVKFKRPKRQQISISEMMCNVAISRA